MSVMKGVSVRLNVATPYRRSRNPDTSSAPKPRLPPVTSATLPACGVSVASSRSANLRRRIGAGPNWSLIARFLETLTVMILRDHIDDGRHLVALELLAAELAHTPFERIGIFRHQRRDLSCDDLAGDRIRLAAHGDVFDVVELEQNVFDLGRMNLLAANVYQLRFAAENANILAVSLDQILRVEPSVRIERGGGVQIAQHRARRSDPEQAVDDLVLEAGVAELEPYRTGVSRLGRQDAELRQPIGLLEPHLRQSFADSRERARGHRFGAVGDDLERGKVMTPDGVGDQHESQERRRRRQQLDPMRRNRRASGIRTALARGNDGPAVAEPVQQRVDAADMVEQQKDDRAIGRSRRLELRQQPVEIEDRSLAFSGRARAEQNQTGCFLVRELAQQRMAHGTLEAGDLP